VSQLKTKRLTVYEKTDRPGQPLLTVLITVWNRADTLRRCIDSVLSQSFTDFEVVAVDDCSSDNSVQVLREYDDPRVRVLAHAENAGQWATRQTGNENACGRWILHLDSDDELLPGALARISQMAREAPDEVGMVGMSYLYDDGTVGPIPAFPSGIVGFEEWLSWTDRVERMDILACYRKEVTDREPMPTDGRDGVQFMLRLASNWKAQVDPKHGGLVHSDAANQMHRGHSNVPLEAQIARATMSTEILQEFGWALRKYAPHRYLRDLFMAGHWYLVTGRRIAGSRCMVRYLLGKPFSMLGWGHLLVGLLGPRALNGLIEWNRRRRWKRAALSENGTEKGS